MSAKASPAYLPFVVLVYLRGIILYSFIIHQGLKEPLGGKLPKGLGSNRTVPRG